MDPKINLIPAFLFAKCYLVFICKEAKEKTEQFKVKNLSMREARDIIDSRATGITAGGKVQTVLIGRKVIEQKNWFSLLDLFYRDPKMRLNADIVFVNGSVSDIIEFSPKNKPRLSIFIAQLIKTANYRNVSVRTTLAKYASVFLLDHLILRLEKSRK